MRPRLRRLRLSEQLRLFMGTSEGLQPDTAACTYLLRETVAIIGLVLFPAAHRPPHPPVMHPCSITAWTPASPSQVMLYTCIIIHISYFTFVMYVPKRPSRTRPPPRPSSRPGQAKLREALRGHVEAVVVPEAPAAAVLQGKRQRGEGGRGAQAAASPQERPGRRDMVVWV